MTINLARLILLLRSYVISICLCWLFAGKGVNKVSRNKIFREGTESPSTWWSAFNKEKVFCIQSCSSPDIVKIITKFCWHLYPLGCGRAGRFLCADFRNYTLMGNCYKDSSCSCIPLLHYILNMEKFGTLGTGLSRLFMSHAKNMTGSVSSFPHNNTRWYIWEHI